jgi:uncharacterized protein involved in exopolysaccharide biosynthesis
MSATAARRARQSEAARDGCRHSTQLSRERENGRLPHETEELRRKLAEREKQIADAEKRIAEREKQIADTPEQIADAEKQIADLERQLAGKRRTRPIPPSRPPQMDWRVNRDCAANTRASARRVAGPDTVGIIGRGFSPWK